MISIYKTSLIVRTKMTQDEAVKNKSKNEETKIHSKEKSNPLTNVSSPDDSIAPPNVAVDIGPTSVKKWFCPLICLKNQRQ
jgi:hypothetical protein